MSAMAGSVRFEVGFRGGGSTSGEVSADQWAAFEEALTAGEGLVQLATADARLWIRVDELVYVRRHERDRRPGFGV